MPQTRFVLRHALQKQLRPVVVINKIDRPAARPLEIAELTQDLFLELATDAEQALLSHPLRIGEGGVRGGGAGGRAGEHGAALRGDSGATCRRPPGTARAAFRCWWRR